MTTGQIFTKWDETHSELWSHQPIRLEHEMHKSPAFSMDDLAKLIEGYPREHYSLVQTGAKGSSRVWREGDIGNLSGREVIDAISRGGLWLNMRDVGSVDSRYRKMVDKMFEEIHAKMPAFEIPKGHQESILISAPNAQVYYHADMPGQSLVQIGLDLVVDLLLLGQRRQQLRPAGVEEGEQLGLVGAQPLDVDGIEEAVGRGIDDDDLLLDRQRLILRLLEHFDQPPAAIELALRLLVEVTAELRERRQLAVLREIEPQRAGHLPHRLDLRRAADA